MPCKARARHAWHVRQRSHILGVYCDQDSVALFFHAASVADIVVHDQGIIVWPRKFTSITSCIAYWDAKKLHLQPRLAAGKESYAWTTMPMNMRAFRVDLRVTDACAVTWSTPARACFACFFRDAETWQATQSTAGGKGVASRFA
jgi:hypothetical protein